VGYLKTILTYNIPAEAEVDKAFLESNGITSFLLNANTSRNELGAPFYVRLQVMEADVGRACDLIREVNPRRFGSAERVDEIDRQIKRSLLRFAAMALPAGVAAGWATYLLSAAASFQTMVSGHPWEDATYFRIKLAIFVGAAASIAAAALLGRSTRGAGH
jgi:hypothetical protein